MNFDAFVTHVMKNNKSGILSLQGREQHM